MKSGAWPHQFIKVNGPYHLPPSHPYEKRSDTKGRSWYELACRHCGVRFKQGYELRPTGPCDKRTDAREMAKLRKKRLI